MSKMDNTNYKSQKKRETKIRTCKHNSIEARVSKKGVGTGKMSTPVVSVRSKGNHKN